ncbi:MAG: Cof-type HAD-IIB family hydrolase [Candidatus Eremiobacteraeota bacterium]|nr:Cof-type HAD-IIB family hydrolase [Candidatus Eremiobacteraeota bacterium]
MSGIALLAFDLDGTLIDRTLTIAPRVLDAVARARAQGVRGCIVTGRMFRAAVQFARQLDFEAPVICYQGAAIVDPASDEVLQHTPLAGEVVRRLIAHCKADGKHLQLFKNDRYYVEEENSFSDLYAKLSQARPIVVSSLETEFARSPATKAVIIDTSERSAQYAGALQTAFAHEAYVTRSYPEFTEVLDARINKGEALRFVAGVLGISMERVMAVGDSWNDIPLLTAAGLGVAMGSAPPEVQRVADAVVGEYAQDGVAEAIEKYVLQ